MCKLQSRALLYLFTLTHSVMEAMAAAEQAIELATATTSPATATTSPATATTSPATAGNTQAPPSTTAAAGARLNGHPHTQATPTAAPSAVTSPDAAQHVQHSHMDPLQEALQLQRPSLSLVEEAERDDEAQPLIAAPKGLLQVSLDQRPAKKYLDRSASLLCMLCCDVL